MSTELCGVQTIDHVSASKLFDAVIEAGLIFLIVFTPFAFGAVELWAYTIMELVVLLLVAVWVLKMVVIEREIRLPRTSLNLPIILFICLVFLQLLPLPEALLKIFSPGAQNVYSQTLISISANQLTASHEVLSSGTVSLNTYATKTELLKILTYIGVFFLIVGNINTDRQKNRLIAAVIATGFVLSVFGIFQSLTWNEKLYWMRELTYGGNPFGPFVNKNNFAGYITMIIPLSLAMLFVKRVAGIRFLLGFAVVVMGTALFMSLSRSGGVAFFGAVCFMGLLLMLSMREYSDRKRVAFIIGSFLVALSFYLLLVGIDPVVERFSTLTEKGTYIRELRVPVWTATVGMIKDFPIVGIGLASFESVFTAYRPVEASGTRWLYAHNDYLQLIAETGFAGTIIALMFLARFFGACLASFMDSVSSYEKFLLIGLVSSAIGFMLSITFTSSTHIPAVALLFVVILAMAVKLSGQKDIKKCLR